MKYTEDLVPRVFFDALSPKLKLLFEEILQEGMSLTMVGGATRDFLLYGRVAKDIDLEIRMDVHLDEEEWKKTLFVLGQRLRASYHVEFLPFGILRIRLGEYVVEFSSPRVEEYSENGPWGHSDFSAKLSPAFSYEDSFRRRDFTINAIGFEFSDLIELRIQDPYRGIEDLKAGILRPCSEDFFKDPVRLLRLVRFSKSFNYRLAPSLEINLHEFDLSKLKFFHFFNEAFKLGPTTFLSLFYKLAEAKGIRLSSEVQLFKELLSDHFEDDTSKEIPQLLISKVFSGEKIEADSNLKLISEKLGMKSHFIDQLYELKKVLLAIEAYQADFLIRDLKDTIQKNDPAMSLEEQSLKFIERFFFYEKRLGGIKDLLLSVLSERYKSIIQKVSPFLVGELQGEALFLQLSQDLQISSEKKSLLRLYAHLKQAIITR